MYKSSHSGQETTCADIVFHNGDIYTVNSEQEWASGVAIKDGKFIHVGTDDEVLAYVSDATLVVDLDGQFAMPGLYDMHTHPDLALAPSYAGYLHVGLDSPQPGEVKAAIEKYAIDNPDREWIFGEYFVHFPFRKEGIDPTREWLDSFMPDRPVAIMDRMWGSMLVNSLALKKAGITKHTMDPTNGYIVKDNLTKEPTGILIDGAYSLIMGAMPPTPHGALVRAYRDGARYQSSRGVVGTKYVHVCENRLNALREIDINGDLPVRVEAAISWQDDIFPVKRRWELLAGERHFYRSERLNVNAVKFHFDGTAEPKTSYLLTSWDNTSDWRGKLNLTPEHIFDMVSDLDQRGIRVIAHCTGDAASDIFLDAVEECRERNGLRGIRHQCAHSTLLHNDNLKRFRALDVIAEFSPVGWYPSTFTIGARSAYGMDRLQGAYDIRGIIDAGGIAVMGTDWPVSSIDPWVGFETMVTRSNPWEEMDGTLGKPIAITEAIRVMTINGAYAMDMESDAGSIEVGKFADMIVLNQNLLEIEPLGNLHKTKVMLTMIGGQIVHDPHEHAVGSPYTKFWHQAALDLGQANNG